MRRKLVVLGGSSPYTAALIDSIETRVSAIPAHNLMLVGRNKVNLEIVAEYARNRLSKYGWIVEASSDLPSALEGASMVLHQIRYGGNEGRRADEDMAVSLGYTPDETIGPAVLQTALRLAPELAKTSQHIVDRCPQAWVLNLTNPLSIATALMTDAGITRCIGMCELPRVTALKSANLLDLELDQITWSYAGLNHRGFIVNLESNGKDRITDVARNLGDATLDGIRAEDIISLDAIPTKYFRLLSGSSQHTQDGRAAILGKLSRKIMDELAVDSRRSPSSLKERYLEWYPQSVVPVIEALLTNKPRLLEINVLTSRNIVEEGRAYVSKNGFGPFCTAQTSAPVARWIERFEKHERCLLKAVRQTSPDTIRDAVSMDPVVDEQDAEKCTQKIWDYYKSLRQVF